MELAWCPQLDALGCEFVFLAAAHSPRIGADAVKDIVKSLLQILQAGPSEGQSTGGVLEVLE